MKDMREQIERIRSREDLAQFVEELKSTYGRDGKQGENRGLPSFLDAMAAWISDMDGYFANIGEPCPVEPTWKTMAQILAASTMYE